MNAGRLLDRHPGALYGQHTAPIFLKVPVSRWQLLGGSRSKPEMAEEVLQLRNSKRLDLVESDGKQREVGRVKAIEGDFSFSIDSQKGAIRILVAETQMGMSAVDINQREFLYSAEGEPVVQIRVGTCGGLNTRKLEYPVLGMGDVIIADRNLGSSGAIMQQLGYFPKIMPDSGANDELALFLNKWRGLGGELASDGRFLSIKNHPQVTLALQQAADLLGAKFYVGGSFAKESLYAEGAEEMMLQLREREGVLASEMEQLQNAFLAALARAKQGINAMSGMVLAAIGAVPGPGFPSPDDRAALKTQEETEAKTLQIGAGALALLSRWMKQ